MPRPKYVAPASLAGAAAPPRRRHPFAILRKLQPRFIADIISELRKVTWPSASETRYLSTVVIIVSVAVGLFLGGTDLVFGWIMEKLFF